MRYNRPSRLSGRSSVGRVGASQALGRGFESRRPLQTDHPLIRIAAAAAIVIVKTISIHPERVGAGTAAVTLRMAEAGPPGGTPVPVTCEVVFVI